MRFDFRTVVGSLLQDGPLTVVLIAGAAVLLTRNSPQARTFGAVLVGLLVYGVLWRILAEVVLYQVNTSSPGGVPSEDHLAFGRIWTAWRLVGNLGDAAAVVVLARFVATPRADSVAAVGEAGAGVRLAGEIPS